MSIKDYSADLKTAVEEAEQADVFCHNSELPDYLFPDYDYPFTMDDFFPSDYFDDDYPEDSDL